jgi:hypothetical protein
METNIDKDFSLLVGKTLVSITNKNNEELIFVTSVGETYKLWHWQDCCEDVFIESITGDFCDLLGEPILVAEEAHNSENYPPDIPLPDCPEESFTWTFYKLATRKGYVDIRWFGVSNGYYSESVYFTKVEE